MKGHDLIDFLVLATQQGASDLHLTAGAPPMMRVASVIQPLAEEALSAEDTRRLVVESLKEGQRAKLENEWQLDFALQVDGVGRFRGNACYVSGAIEANFRRIPSEVGDLKSLGHSPVVDRWCDERAGMVLVTGASGEGKSTTLASMAQTIARRRSVNIVSIEDPIEFVHSQGRSLVNQREVGSDVRNFASALKNALRQDADIILVGELRDTDTIQTAITAAETGHLVIGTMHTNDAPTAIGRVLDAFPKEGQQFVGAQLAWSLLGVVCQNFRQMKCRLREAQKLAHQLSYRARSRLSLGDLRFGTDQRCFPHEISVSDYMCGLLLRGSGSRERRKAINQTPPAPINELLTKAMQALLCAQVSKQIS